MIRQRLAVPFVVLIVLVLSACSSGSAATSGPGGATNAPGQPTQAGATQNSGGGSSLPCNAIKADVVAAVGKTLGNLDAGATKCEFQFGGTADTAGMDGVVSVRLEVPNSTSLASVKLGFPGGDDVSGLGDAAYWAKGVYVMYAVSHGNVYAVQTVLLDPSLDLKTMETTIMRSLLAHL